MLKFFYEGKNYNYEHAGFQNYDINTEIVMNEDCSLDDIMEAIVRLTKIAGFYASKDSFLRAIDNVLEE